MSLSNGQAPDDRTLVRYLVGLLTDEEAERLDELSVADDEFASHLSAVENDLVDAYVNGELAGETLGRFKSHYLSSPAKREKVRFAETLRRYQPAAATPVHATSGGRWFGVPLWVPEWGLAAAVLLILATAGYLLVDNLQLRREMADSRMARATLEERERQLQQQLNEQQTATAETARQLARVREALTALEARAEADQRRGGGAVLAFNLRPATRGAGDIATIGVPPGTEAIMLRLQLEADDFPRYRVALKEARTDRIIWSSAALQAASSGDGKSLSIRLRASVLDAQTYTLELTGIAPGGASELVGSYLFRVVRQ
jgi:hypothetical protein